MQKLQILSVNLSEKKGTIKLPVDSIVLNHLGVEGDAHAGPWHRQVSLLGKESFDKMQTSMERELIFGEFAENITTEGYPLFQMRPLDQLTSGNVILEVTQIGKKCHGSNCAILKETGDCVMPKEGIFCRVIKGGKLQAGDEIIYQPKILNIKIITVSDRASRGEYEDKSGPYLKTIVEKYFTENYRKTEIEINVVPDEPEILENLIKQHIENKADLVFTTGGTGIGSRDITPDTIKPLLEKEIPGIMELIRVKYGMQFPNALISRGIAGVTGQTLIYTLPGNPKAVEEYAGEILKTIEHSLRMLYNIDNH
jgi:molybdenum cofactor synthesis domain-containing protein